MASIFISYRREDAGGHAGRLCDRLTTRFGDDRVFLDIQDIQPGQNFEQSIDATIAACDCVLAVIGPRWLHSLRERDGRDDFVRRELAAALQKRSTLIPVLVGGARMPAADALPADIAPLSRLNAIEVRDEHFDDDVARLTAFVATTIGAPAVSPPAAAPLPTPRPAPRGPLYAAAALLLIVAAAVGVAVFRPPSP